MSEITDSEFEEIIHSFEKTLGGYFRDYHVEKNYNYSRFVYFEYEENKAVKKISIFFSRLSKKVILSNLINHNPNLYAEKTILTFESSLNLLPEEIQLFLFFHIDLWKVKK